jgi:hypothetical protein
MNKFPGDTTPDTDPIQFSIAFVTAMRKERGLSQVPSLRTTLAIPRFLTARWFRTRALAPRDYLDAAVLCSPPEDHSIATKVAREILFPRKEEPVVASVVAEAPAPAPAAPSVALRADPTKSILEDLASLDVDLDALGSLGDLDALLDEADRGAFRSFDLYESLHGSEDPRDRALGSLISRFGGAPELEANGVKEKSDAVDFARAHLRGRIGELLPDDIVDGIGAGFGDLLRVEVKQPWELAGALAGTRDFDNLGRHLDDILGAGSTRDIGRTLKFLEPHAGVVKGSEFAAFRDAGLARARDLADHAELVDGLGRWIAPNAELVKRSAVDNVTRALTASKWIDRAFGQDLSPRVFEHWADAQTLPPDLETLVDLVVPCKRWEVLVEGAYGGYLGSIVSESAVGDA